jgi:2-polyprenyl-6-methoxyphenol hydroxylase-like FAD-dependent oxidoreductase
MKPMKPMGMGQERVETLVVGGGIGGLAAALALSRQGMPVCVLEQAHEFGEIGAGIQLAPNALRMLERLGLVDRIAANAFYPRKAVLMSAVTGRRLTALDFGVKFREAYGYPYIVMHRSDLLAALLDACRASPLVTLRNDRKVHGLGQGAEEVVVACSDGSTYRARAVVGADGIWSTVRRFTIGDDELVCSRDVAYRGTAPIQAVPEHSGLDVVWWAGPKLHLIQYPIRRGELLNQVAVFTSDQYRPDTQDWGTPDELEERFAGKHEHVRAGLRLIGRERRWLLYDRAPVDNWTRGRVTLLGDAAHPMLQYLAQGACMALEDAVCLADSMRAYGTDPAKAFLIYQGERIARTSMAQRWARGMGELVHLDGMGALLRDMVLGDRADDDYSHVDWLYGYGATG